MGSTGIDAGTTVGRWVIETLVAVGGSAEVYRAREQPGGRAVAVKLLRAEAVPDSDRWRRFLDEVRASTLLRHPRIARVEEAGEYDGRPYMVVEWVDGVTLGERLASGPLPPAEVLRVMHGVADALAAVHSLGVVHRDLSPSNIMLGDDGGVKLLDFGLAKAVRAESGVTKSWATSDGCVIGTPEYLSPEQARGEAATFASDVFSFGSVLWEALSGRSPYRRKTVVETLHAVVEDEAPSVPRTRDRAARALYELAGACLRPAPTDRPLDARHLVAELDRIRSGRPRRHGRRRPLAVAAAVVAVVLGSFSGWILGHSAKGDPPTRGFELIPLEGQIPRITPDGLEVVHVSPDGREIWRVPLGQGNPQMVWAGEARILSLELAPDGRAVVFGVEADRHSSTWEVAITGGLARKLGRGVPLAVSPSGDTVLSLIRRAPAHSDLTACRRDGTDQRLVHAFRGALIPRSAAYLDEKRILVSLTDGLRVSRLVSVRLSDGGAETVTEVEGVAESGLAVLDAPRCAVWCIRRSSDSLFLAGVTPLGSGGFRMMLAGPSVAEPSVCRDGQRLLLTTQDRTSELVEVEVAPGGDQPASSGYRVLPHTRDSAQPRVSRDGRRVAFQSALGNVWILDRESGSVGPFLTTGESSFNAVWSPDGGLVAYSCLQGQQSELWVAGADGGDPRPVTHDVANDFQPLWHADGRHLLFISDRDGREDLYRLDIATGEVVRLHAEGAINPAVSRDGRAVAFVVPSEQGHGWLRIHALEPDVTLGRLLWERRVVRDSWAGAKPRFSPDGRWLAFDRPSEPFGADVWVAEAATGDGLHRLTHLPFPASLLGWFDWLDDGRLVITVARRPSRFLVLHDLPRWLERSLKS